MARIRLAAAVLVLIFGAGLAAAQQPTFSGTWIIQPPNKAAGKERTIKQDAKSISVTGPGRPMTCQLDGVQKRETVAMRGGEIVILTKAVWVKNTIVVEIVTMYPNNINTFERETWSIDAKGQLVIEFAETAEGQQVRSMKIVYKKKS